MLSVLDNFHQITFSLDSWGLWKLVEERKLESSMSVTYLAVFLVDTKI